MWTVWTVARWAIPVQQGRSGVYSRALAAQAPGARLAIVQPWRIQLSGGSDPEGTDSAGGWCWQSHQVPPGQSS